MTILQSDFYKYQRSVYLQICKPEICDYILEIEKEIGIYVQIIENKQKDEFLKKDNTKKFYLETIENIVKGNPNQGYTRKHLQGFGLKFRFDNSNVKKIKIVCCEIIINMPMQGIVIPSDISRYFFIFIHSKSLSSN